MKFLKFILLLSAIFPMLPANAYIDPATGSMLFSVFLGVVTTLFFLFQALFLKIKMFICNGKNDLSKDRIPFVIYSEGKQYWSVFKPILNEFEKRNIDVTFYTSSKDDKVFESGYKFIHPKYIGEGNTAFFKLAMLNADVCLMTTPGLDVLQLKRSKNVKHYAHILHSPSDSTRYKLFGFDYFDSIFTNGEFQVSQIRELEHVRNLPSKELPIVGCAYLDDLQSRLSALNVEKSEKFTVLIAPTWGESSLLNKYGTNLIDKILKDDRDVIIRPHPQSLKVEKDLIENLQKHYENNKNVIWDFAPDNLQTLAKSDIMISDFSGVIFDFAFLFKKPFMFVNEKINKEIYDMSDCKTPLFALTKIKDLGIEIKEDNFDKIDEMIETTLHDEAFAQKAEELKNIIWQEQGKAAENIVNFLVEKQKEAVKC